MTAVRGATMGDLGRLLQSRRHYAGLAQDVRRLSTEVTTGAKADRGRAVSGDFTALAAFDRVLAVAEAERAARSEAKVLTGTLQTMLGTAQDAGSRIAVGLMAATTATGTGQVDALAADARQKFRTAVAALNTQVGGRYVLSGAATDAKPVGRR